MSRADMNQEVETREDKIKLQYLRLGELLRAEEKAGS
jgi:hypothetical protein